MTLRERCQAILDQIQSEGVFRQLSAAEVLQAFVLTEIGRTADERLNESLPLVLYFPTDADREEFIAAVREAKPDMIGRKMP